MFPLAENEALVNVILIHFMVSIRFLAMMTTATIFMLPSFPNQAKFWVSVMLAVIVTPLVNVSIPQVLLGSWMYVFVMTGREFLLGASIGLIAGLPAYAMQASGFMDGMLMGFNMMNMFDPLSATQTSVMSQIKYFIAVWFLMQWDGHILIVHALAESVNLVPPGVSMWPRGDIPWIDWLQRIFVIALKLSLPVFGAVLLADVGLGFVARTVPQMNVFILGIPLKITVGLLVLLAVLPSTVDIFHDEIEAAVEYALAGAYFWR
ncbi:MAG: flagellar biosynthetic protein FliR [Synergistaceae bacterium]|jgi:flagellar biosynthetic protein FliR|nr:flagellar biosynthetic protein FliR [Synergistaceae bacterium]